MVTGEITYRQLVAADLQRLAEIDRAEHIETVYVRGTQLEERDGDFSAAPWLTGGEGEHSVASQRAECEQYLTAGGP